MQERFRNMVTNKSLPARYKVYHANNPLAMVFPCAESWQADRGSHFTHVATVEASTVEQVFSLTNHGATEMPDWMDNPEVVWYAVPPLRSTSVGDVIVCLQTGQAWLVVSRGL